MPFNWTPLWLAARVAGAATAGAIFPGLWLTYMLATREFAGRRAAVALLAVLLAVPVVLVAFFLFRPAFPWEAGAFAGVLGAIPLIAFGASTPLQQLERDYGNASRSIGASVWRVFARVMLPLAWRPILAVS